MKIKSVMWLVLGETIGSQHENLHIEDICLTRDEAINQANHIELNDNAMKCYVEKHCITHKFKGKKNET